MSGRSSPHAEAPASLRRGFITRLIDPIHWLTETIYSVLVLLSFTLAFRIFNLGQNPEQIVSNEYVDALLLASLEAIFAWGVIDAVMHLLLEQFQRSDRHRFLRQLQGAASEQAAVEVIAEELDTLLEPITAEEERRQLYRRLITHLKAAKPQPATFRLEDLFDALGSILMALLAVLPSLIPFLLLRHDYALAIRVSNIVSFVVLFIAGFSWGRHTGSNPWKTGLLLVGVAALMVAVAIPFGG